MYSKSDHEWFRRLQAGGVPLDLEGSGGAADEHDGEVTIYQDDESLGDTRAIVRHGGGAVYVLPLHIVSDKAERYIMRYRITTEWDAGIFLIPPSGRSYSICQGELEFSFDEVLNHRKGIEAGRFGGGRFLKGTLLGYGGKPIPAGLHNFTAKVTITDQFDEEFSASIDVLVDRSWMSKGKRRGRTLGLFEPEEGENLAAPAWARAKRDDVLKVEQGPKLQGESSAASKRPAAAQHQYPPERDAAPRAELMSPRPISQERGLDIARGRELAQIIADSKRWQKQHDR